LQGFLTPNARDINSLLTCYPHEFPTFFTFGRTPMEKNVLLWSLVTVISLLCMVAGCAIAYWVGASRSTPSRKSKPATESTPTSAVDLANIQADQAALFSTLEKLTTTVKRLSSRAGMEDVRARRKGETSDHSTSGTPPPQGTNKADLWRYYMPGATAGPEFAKRQQLIESDQHKRPN